MYSAASLLLPIIMFQGKKLTHLSTFMIIPCFILFHLIIQLRNCQSDEQLQHLLMQDDVFAALDSIGYRGNPQKETLLTCDNILQ